MLNNTSRPEKGRVLLVGNFLSKIIKGNKSFSETLADQLEETGWSVIRVSNYLPPAARISDMILTAYNSRHKYQVAHVDVFSGRGFIWAEAVCQVLQWLGKPYFITLRGGRLPEFADRWPKRVRRLLKKAHTVVTPSRHIQSELSNLRSDIQYLSDAVDLRRYSFRLRKNAVPRLCWLRSFHSIYNPTMAVEALTELTAEFPMIQMEMIGPDKGDGSLRAVKDLIGRAGVSERIKIIEGISNIDVPRRIGESDIFLNTTFLESFGVSVMEAAAAGLCIITTNVGELPYLWTEGLDALMVPPNDAAAMAKAARRILTDPRLAEHLSHNARQKALNFSWSSVLPQWEQLLRKVGRLPSA
jgi:glycosyltransferase involved in cell wall biosynthesis